jgi:hypothetical protein
LLKTVSSTVQIRTDENRLTQHFQGAEWGKDQR